VPAGQAGRHNATLDRMAGQGKLRGEQLVRRQSALHLAPGF
jgi:hypothetical protein